MAKMETCGQCNGEGIVKGTEPDFVSNTHTRIKKQCPTCGGSGEVEYILKSIDDYVHPDKQEKPLSFQDAKDKKVEEEDGPRLESEFDFMDGDNFIKMKIETKIINKKKTVRLHYAATVHIEHSFMSGWVEQCFAHKEVSLKWYDWFFGIHSLEEKVEYVATLWMRETKADLKDKREAYKISEEFKGKFSRK